MISAEATRSMGWVRTSSLVALGILVFLCIAASYSLYNPNTLKPLAGFLSEQIFGRTLSIDGDLTLELSMQPRISGRKVTLGNSEDGIAPYLAVAEYALVQIDLAGLLDRYVDLLHVEVHDAQLHLEDSVDGRPNWQFFDSDSTDDDGGWSVMIRGMNVEGSTIHATIGELEPIELTIPKLVEKTNPDGHLHLDGHGLLNDRPWLVDGQIGPFDELISAGQIELDLNLMVDDAEIIISGSIGRLSDLSELDLALRVFGPDADVLGEIFRMPEAFREDILLNATIRPEGDSHAVQIDGHISAFEIQTTGTVSDLKNFNGWDGRMNIHGPEAAVFGKALQFDGFPDGPFQIRGGFHLNGGDIDLKEVEITTEDVELTLNADFADFPRRDDASGDLRLSGPDISQLSTLLKVTGLPTKPFELNLSLDATRNEVVTASFSMGSHTLVAAGPIGEFPDFHGTRLTVSFSGPDITEILAITGEHSMLLGAYQIQGQLALEADGLRLTEVDLRSGPFHFNGSQSWEDLSQIEHFIVEGTLKVSDLAEAAAPFTDRTFPEIPASIQADVRAHAEGFEVRSSSIRFRSLQASVSGELGTFTNRAGLDLNISVDGPSVDLLFSDAVPDDAKPVPFALRSGVKGTTQGIQIHNLKLEAKGGTFGADGFVALNSDYTGSHLTLEGSGSSLAALVPEFPSYQPPDLPWQLNADVAIPEKGLFSVTDGQLGIGSVQMTLSGILDVARQARTSLTYQARGDRITDIGRIGDVPWPDHAFNFSTELQGTLDGLNIQHLIARWGENDLEGSGNIDLRAKPILHIQGTSKVLNIIDLQHALFGDLEDTEPEDDADRVFADIPLPIEYLAELDAYLDIQVDAFRGRRSSLDDIDLKLDIVDGQLLLERAQYRDEIGSFNASGIIRPEGDSVYLELKLLGEDTLFKLFTSEDQAVEATPRYSLDIDISGIGNTYAELASHLQGKILISSDGGQISNDVLNAFAGDFLSNVLKVLNPFAASEEFTQMECMVLNAAIIDGRVTMEPGFVMRTDQLNMFVYGNVNLGTEKLDLSLATQARRGIGISAASITNPYFKVGGTLAEPALQLDPASATVAASVATMTAGLSILFKGVWDRLLGTRNPCPDFLKYEQELDDPPPR